MYTPEIFLYAALWASIAFLAYVPREWIKANLEEIKRKNANDAMKVKAIQLLVPVLFFVFAAAVILCIGTLVTPLLIMLFGEFMAKLGAFIDKFGGWFVIIGIAVFWWREKHPKPKTDAELTPPKPPIDEMRARAERTYSTMQQTAYVIFTDACRYLSGLVAPLSLAAVTASVKFDILPSGVVIYYFTIGKGNCDAPVDTLREILEHIIDQRLRAKDLPLAVEPVYVSADGSTWPSLVVDGVHDLGSSYRVDLVITDEAEVARLKARGVASFDDGANAAQPNDPDFG